MHPIFLPRGHAATTVPVTFVNSATWREQREGLDSRARAFADAAGFEPKAGRHLLLPGADGALAGVLFALEPPDDGSKDLFRPGSLAGVSRCDSQQHDRKRQQGAGPHVNEVMLAREQRRCPDQQRAADPEHRKGAREHWQPDSFFGVLDSYWSTTRQMIGDWWQSPARNIRNRLVR